MKRMFEEVDKKIEYEKREIISISLKKSNVENLKQVMAIKGITKNRSRVIDKLVEEYIKQSFLNES